MKKAGGGTMTLIKVKKVTKRLIKAFPWTNTLRLLVYRVALIYGCITYWWDGGERDAAETVAVSKNEAEN